MTDNEHDEAGLKYIIPTIIRVANRKTVRELHDEIRAAQERKWKNAMKRFRLLFLPTMLSQTLLLDLRLDREKASTAVEGNHGDGGILGRGYVRGRGRLGHSSRSGDDAHADSGRHWREAGSRGWARSPSGSI